MYDNDLFDILRLLENPPKDIGEQIENAKNIFLRKGYGTPELELKFLHNIFLRIQSEHPGFQSFAWTQYNDFNDNCFYFNIEDFIVNHNLYVSTEIDYDYKFYPKNAIDLRMDISAIDYDQDLAEMRQLKTFDFDLDGPYNQIKSINAYMEYAKIKYQHLEVPCQKMLVLLKLLEINCSIYYFLYTLGNGVKVSFDAEGVTVTKLQANQMGGRVLGDGMDLDDYK